MQTHDERSEDWHPPSPMNLNTPQEVAKPMLKISLHTLYELIYQGQLKATKVGRQWRISDRAIADFLGENEEVR